MRFIDRFTRDDVSAKVWWPFTMVLVVLFVLTFPGAHRAIAARHRDAAAIDAALSQRVIQPLVASAPASSTITGPLSASLTEEVNDEILVNDTRITAIRIWSRSHVLLWSTLPNDDIGSDRALNDSDIDAGATAGGAPTWVVTERTPTNQPGPATFYSYTAMGAQPLISQFEYRDATLTSDVRAAWLGYQISLGLGFLLALTFSILSMREPMAKIGTGVPFYPESVPKYLAVVDVDRAVAIEQAGDRIKERVTALQRKLDESETARLRAEGKLQQALAALATPGHRMPVPTPPVREVVEVPEVEPVAVEPEPVAVEPEPVAVEPEPVAVEPEPVAVEPELVPVPRRAAVLPKKEKAAKAKPRPVAAPAPAPSAPEPIVVTPEPEPVVETLEPEPVVETPQPEPAPIVPPPEPAPPPEPIVVPERQPAPVAKLEPTDASGWPEVVIVPELHPARTSTGTESASDMLDRLVEPVSEHASTDDTSDLRAKLARTAALKKPGSKERREADEQHRS